MNQRERINLIAQMRCLKSSWLGLGASNISVLLILLNVIMHVPFRIRDSENSAIINMNIHYCISPISYSLSIASYMVQLTIVRRKRGKGNGDVHDLTCYIIILDLHTMLHTRCTSTCNMDHGTVRISDVRVQW